MRTALAISASMLALACGGGAGGHDTFSFGRTGGSIAPYTVTVTRDGTVRTTGPVRLRDPSPHLASAQLLRLDRLVDSTRFFGLPARTLCAGSLPDFASLFVTVTSGSRRREVLVRGSCSPRFAKLYQALAAAVGMQ